jgi:hypothetical protein
MARCKIEEEDQRKWQLERPKSLTKRGSARRPNLRAFRQGKEDEQLKDRSGRTKSQEEKSAEREKNGKDKKKSYLQQHRARPRWKMTCWCSSRSSEDVPRRKGSRHKREGQKGASMVANNDAHSGRRCNRPHLHAPQPIHLKRDLTARSGKKICKSRWVDFGLPFGHDKEVFTFVVLVM